MAGAANQDFARFSRRQIHAFAIDNLVSKPQGSPGDPILFSPGGTGLEKMLPHSLEPMAWISGSLNLSRNSRCNAGESGAEDERRNRMRVKAAWRVSAFGSFQSRSCEMMVGTKADQVQR